MENSFKQSKMSHNGVRWKLRESSAVWRSSYPHRVKWSVVPVQW